MHSLTICFGPAATVWTLLFKNPESLEAARATLVDTRTATIFALTDDFGQNITLVRDAIHGFMFEDMDLSQLGAIERGLHQARTQAKAETKAMTDEVIKNAIRAKQQGPAVYQPGMNGRGF